jgi:hypothetical protein
MAGQFGTPACLSAGEFAMAPDSDLMPILLATSDGLTP